MRIAVVTESYPPQVNGVAGSVVRLREQLSRLGHASFVVAPAVTSSGPDDADPTVVRVPSVTAPGYPGHRVALPWRGVRATLEEYAPDVVHLASPTVLGAQAARLGRRLGLPTVAVYQTDLAGFARHYGHGWASPAMWHWLRQVHNHADLTLAPSRAAAADLAAHGVRRVRIWPRGVDLDRFHPRRRDRATRRLLAPGGEVLVGYVGRLAAEKQVGLLADTVALPGVRVVVVGDGPLHDRLRRALPGAVFTGALDGDELARVVASLDVLAHTGPAETFCQAAQEALAAGVPVVGPAAGGLLDLVDDGRNGLLYRPGSGPALAAAVALLAADPLLRRRFALAARASVEGRSWRTVTRQYLDLCEGLVHDGTTALTPA